MSTANNFVPGSSGMAADSDIPIAHLDYDYVKDCTDVAELEKIIAVLRSGSEGFFPQLVEFTEKKLKEINPKSDVLRKDKPALNLNELDADEKKAVTETFLNWTDEANDLDKKLKESNPEAEVNHVDDYPPVRSKKTIVDDGNKENVSKPTNSSSKKSVKPRDFKEWDKFDIDKELENVDKVEESKANGVETKSSIKIQPVATKDLNVEERLFRAVKEKEKGNEAFKAQDFDEAVVYYTNSLKYEPTAASYNNRAAAELKIEKYPEAIEDCNQVLQLEPSNIKAFLRRGMAYKALERYEEAVSNFESMLQIEPKNKRAKDLLAEIETSKRASEKSKLESKNGEPSHDVKNETMPNKDNAGDRTKKKGQRVKIEEIDNMDDVSVGNRVDDLRPGNEKSEENTVPDTVEETELEKVKKLLEDLKAVNSVKDEKEGMSEDTLVNSEPSADPKESEVGDGVDRCLATEPESELKNKVIDEVISESGDSSKVVENKGFEKMEQDVNKQEVVLELPEEVKCLMKEGNDLYKMGHHSEALLKYALCVERLWPERESYATAVSGIFNNKAACYFKMGDCKQCVLECDESLKLIDNNLNALTRRGKAYETMEKYAEAFRDFNRVRLIDSSNTLAQEHCSRVIKHLEMLHGNSWRKKIFEASQNDYSKHQKDPDVKENIHDKNQVKSNLTKVYGGVVESQKASPQPDNSPNAGKKGPVNGAPQENKEESGASIKDKFLKLKQSGNSFVKQGKFEEAIRCYTDCINLCPKEVAIYTNRALCYLKQSKYDLTEADCNTALSIETNNIKALFRRANARKGLGRYREASDDLVQLLKVDGKNSAAKNELPIVLGLLKKQKQEEGKSVPKRKKILIQDIDGEDDKKPTIAPSQQATTSKPKAKKKQNGKDFDKEKPKSPPPETDHKEKKKASNPFARALASRKESEKKKGEVESTKKTTNPIKETRNKNNVADNPSRASGELPRKQKGEVAEEKKKPSPLTETDHKENIKAGDVKASPQDTEKPKVKSNVKTTKASETSPVEYNDKSGFQFFQDWKSVKKNATAEYLYILKQVRLANLPEVMSSKLDGEMMKSILEALNLELERDGDVKFVYQFLQKLTVVDRFDMTLMFLSKPEKQVGRTLFDKIEKQNDEQTGINSDDLSKLRQKYQL